MNIKLLIKHSTKIFGIITILLFTFLCISFISLRSQPTILGEFGLFSILSTTFLLSCVLLVLVFILVYTTKEEDCWAHLLLIVQIFILMLILFATPSLLEEMPRFRTAYKVFGMVHSIMVTGYIDTSKVFYHNWPGFFILACVLFQVVLPFHSAQLTFLKFYPLVAEGLFGFALYIFLNNLFDKKKNILLIIFIFYILNWVGQDYFAPQSLAYILSLFYIGLLFRQQLNEKKIKNYTLLSILSILIFSTITISHVLTNIFVIIFLFIMWMTTLYSHLMTKKAPYHVSSLNVLLPLILFVSWTIYGASNYFNIKFSKFLESALKFDILSVFHTGTIERISGSYSHILVSQIMLYFVTIAGIFAIIGFVCTIISKKRLDWTDKFLIMVVVSASLILLLGPYGGEIMMRIYFLCLPVLGYYIAKNFEINRISFLIATLFLIVGLPLHMFVHYGNENVHYVSTAEISSYNYFYKAVNSGYMFGGYPGGCYINDLNYIDISIIEVLDSIGDGEITTLRGSTDMWDHYIFFTRGDYETLKGLYTEHMKNYTNLYEKIMNSQKYNLIYSSKDVKIFKG